MPTTMQGGFGVVAKIDVSATLTTVVNLLDIDWPKFRNYITEATGHDSAGGYYEAVATGKKRVESFKVTLGWDVSNATHAQIVTAFTDGNPRPWTIADPDSDETIAISVIVEEIQRISRQEDGYKAEILMHPTGQPTITP